MEFENDLKLGEEKLNILNQEKVDLNIRNKKRNTEVEYLSNRIQSQDKLIKVCKDQEAIINKLEDLFAQTKISIDNKWRKEVNDLVEQTRGHRQRYPNGYHYPYPLMQPQPMLLAPQAALMAPTQADNSTKKKPSITLL